MARGKRAKRRQGYTPPVKPKEKVLTYMEKLKRDDPETYRIIMWERHKVRI